MPNSISVLFAGESWVTHTVHIKGFDSFETSTYAEGGTELIATLRDAGIAVEYQPSHVAANTFPTDADALAAYDVVILSDIGANTLLLPDRTFVRSLPTANRLELIAEFVQDGGGLLMIGGYLTFQGIQAKGNYHNSAVERVMPVVLSATDDRIEAPQGLTPTIVDSDHPVLSGLHDWPNFLGYNRAALHPEAHLVATIGDDPFIAVRDVGKGRSAIFASDCGPHWGPPAFLNWSGYDELWVNLVNWLGGRSA